VTNSAFGRRGLLDRFRLERHNRRLVALERGDRHRHIEFARLSVVFDANREEILDSSACVVSHGLIP
jgi:hypothetical protein